MCDKKEVKMAVGEDMYDKLAHTAKGFIEATNAATPRDNSKSGNIYQTSTTNTF